MSTGESITEYVQVVGRWGQQVGDGLDPDSLPNFLAPDAGSTVTLTPAKPATIATDPEGNPLGLTRAPITCTFDADGWLTFNGEHGVWVADLGGPGVNPVIPRNEAAWTATFNLRYGGKAYPWPTINFNPVAGSVCNLVTATGLPLGPGSVIVRGPEGTGVASLDVDGDHLTWSLTDGSTGETPLPAALVEADAQVAAFVAGGTETRAALDSTVGVARYAISDSGLFVSKDGDDGGDGLSPGRAKATVAAAAAALPDGRGRINLSGGTHTVNGLELTNGLHIQGHGGGTGPTTLASTGDVFTIPLGSFVQDVKIRDLGIVSEGGSCFNIGGMLALSTIEDVYIAQVGGEAPAIHAAGLIDTKWRVHIESVNGSTIPLVRLVATVNNVDAIACNSFTGRATHTSGYVFHIEDATGGSFAENNRIFDFNFEQTNLGAVKILSGTGNMLDNCIALDFTASITAPLVHVGKSPASTKLSHNNRISLHRHGGVLSGAGRDIKLISGEASMTTLIDCWADGAGSNIDFGGNQASVLNVDLGNSIGSGLVAGTTPYGSKLIHENPDNLIGAAAAGAGMAVVEPSTHKLWISDGTAWRDAQGVAR